MERGCAIGFDYMAMKSEVTEALHNTPEISPGFENLCYTVIKRLYANFYLNTELFGIIFNYITSLPSLSLTPTTPRERAIHFMESYYESTTPEVRQSPESLGIIYDNFINVATEPNVPTVYEKVRQMYRFFLWIIFKRWKSNEIIYRRS